jgi:hypothetical protein
MCCVRRWKRLRRKMAKALASVTPSWSPRGDAGTTVPEMMSSCKPPFVHEGRLFLRLRGGLLAEGNQRTCARAKKMARRGKMLRSHGV